MMVSTVTPKERWSLHTHGHVSEKPLPRVLVLGAGMSGLVTARILKDTGFPVQVIEARKRLGGRIWTDTSLGVPCDLGAAWIHGVRHNPLTNWCRSLGIKMVRVPKGSIWFYKDGKSYRLSRLLMRGRRGVAKAAYAYISMFLPMWIRKIGGGDPMDISIGRVLDLVCANPQLGEWDRRLLWWLLGLVEAINGASAHALGILEQDVYEYWQTNAAPLGGFNTLIEDAAKGLEIRLNTAVRKIIYSANDVTLVTSNGILSGDLAVVTLPIGILRSTDITFEPSLECQKQQAINSVGYGGVLNKIGLRFPERFWPTGHERLAILSTDPQQRAIFTVWADFSSTTRFPILVGFTSGDFAAHLDQNCSNKDLCQQAILTLKRMFSPTLPYPASYVITRWLSDPWAQGGYSYGAVGDGKELRRKLVEPVADRIFFAGEATHEEHYGTVHGALLSGEREAIRIHQRFCCDGQEVTHFPWRRKR